MKQIKYNFISINYIPLFMGISGILTLCTMHGAANKQKLSCLKSPSSLPAYAPLAGISSSAPSGRRSHITDIQQNEQKLYNSSPHETQFQSPGTLTKKKYYKPIIIPNRYDKFCCGAATVQMALNILSQQGIIAQAQIPTFSELVDLLQIKKQKYATTYDIKKYLSNTLNLKCTLIMKPRKKVIKNLNTIINASRTIPTIALSQGSNSYGHFVLLWDTNEDPCFVTICDPETATPISYLPKQTFYQGCEAIIQITGKNKSRKSAQPTEKKQTPPQPAVSVKRNESSQPKPRNGFALLSETDA